jgi:hypothetical protein
LKLKKVISIAISASIFLSACASSSNDVATTYVSPEQYEGYDCRQISAQMIDIQNQVTQLGGQLDTEASHDKMITGAGIILFWPALFFLGGNKKNEAQYGKLKGDYQALQQEAIVKNCIHHVS